MAQVRHQHQTQSAEEAEKEGVTVCISNYHSQQKIPGSVKKWKVPGKIFITTVSKKNVQKKVTKDHGGFQQQSPQRLVDGYDHTSSRNDRWVMRLKAIKAEYYSIDTLKS